eukprot:403354314
MVDTSFSNPLLFHESIDITRGASYLQQNPQGDPINVFQQSHSDFHPLQLETTGIYGQSPVKIGLHSRLKSLENLDLDQRQRIIQRLEISPGAERFQLKTPDPMLLDRNYRLYNQNRDFGGSQHARSVQQPVVDDVEKLNQILQPIEYNPTEEGDLKSYRMNPHYQQNDIKHYLDQQIGRTQQNSLPLLNYRETIELQNQMLIQNREKLKYQIQPKIQDPYLKQSQQQNHSSPIQYQMNKFAERMQYFNENIYQQPPSGIPRKGGQGQNTITLNPYDEKIKQSLAQHQYSTQLLTPQQSPWYINNQNVNAITGTQNLNNQQFMYYPRQEQIINGGVQGSQNYLSPQQIMQIQQEKMQLNRQQVPPVNLNFPQTQTAQSTNQELIKYNLEFNFRSAWQQSQEIARIQFPETSQATTQNTHQFQNPQQLLSEQDRTQIITDFASQAKTEEKLRQKQIKKRNDQIDNERKMMESIILEQQREHNNFSSLGQCREERMMRMQQLSKVNEI